MPPPTTSGVRAANPRMASLPTVVILAWPLPTIPRHLLTVATGVSVTVEFVVTTKGEVLNARVVNSDNRRFDDVALNAVKRWKFKPGFRQGRTVNVSMSQAIDFTVSGS